MSTDLSGTDILTHYKHISSKLKKRFLRKPNVTEACDLFMALGQHCENVEMPAYAGMCWIATARCEGSLGNIPGETSCLTRSARNFVLTEMKNRALGCQSVANENLQAALSCYAHARARLPENCPLATGINLEIAKYLKESDNTDTSEVYLKDAVEFSQNSPDINVYCLELLASDCIERGDYTTALDTYTEIAKLLETLPSNEARRDVLLNCEISRVFLLLILRFTPQRLPPSFAKLLESFTWGDRNDQQLSACHMSEELFLLLQSLVITCQSMDTSSLPYLEGCLWPHLTTDQKSLLRSLVCCYC